MILITSSSSKKRLAYDEVEIISNITSVASIAIKNAKLYENARLEARTDELTGLLNRKYFYEVLNEEFEKNKDASLALAIINVDDFKLYNQLYGIKEGDMCLQRVADIINSSVGESGIYCSLWRERICCSASRLRPFLCQKSGGIHCKTDICYE